jgi:hypothetical protein
MHRLFATGPAPIERTDLLKKAKGSEEKEPCLSDLLHAAPGR